MIRKLYSWRGLHPPRTPSTRRTKGVVVGLRVRSPVAATWMVSFARLDGGSVARIPQPEGLNNLPSIPNERVYRLARLCPAYGARLRNCPTYGARLVHEIVLWPQGRGHPDSCTRLVHLVGDAAR